MAIKPTSCNRVVTRRAARYSLSAVARTTTTGGPYWLLVNPEAMHTRTLFANSSRGDARSLRAVRPPFAKGVHRLLFALENRPFQPEKHCLFTRPARMKVGLARVKIGLAGQRISSVGLSRYLGTRSALAERSLFPAATSRETETRMRKMNYRMENKT